MVGLGAHCYSSFRLTFADLRDRERFYSECVETLYTVSILQVTINYIVNGAGVKRQTYLVHVRTKYVRCEMNAYITSPANNPTNRILNAVNIPLHPSTPS